MIATTDSDMLVGMDVSATIQDPFEGSQNLQGISLTYAMTPEVVSF